MTCISRCLACAGSLLVLIAALAPITPASAEIRVVARGGALDLEVKSTNRGVWSPSHQLGPGYRLNAEGDLLGDGYPARLAGADRVVVAWLRNGDTLVLSDARAGGENSRSEVSAVGAFGTPVIAPVGDRKLVCWASGATDPVVHAVYWNADASVGESTTVDAGSLISVIPHGDGALLLTANLESGLLRVWRFVPDPQPWPIPVLLIERPFATRVASAKASTRTLSVPCLVELSPSTAGVSWQPGPGLFGAVWIVDGSPGDIVTTRGVSPCGRDFNVANPVPIPLE